MPTYKIELVTRAGNHTCPYTATAPDVFEALTKVDVLRPGQVRLSRWSAWTKSRPPPK